MHRNLQTSGLCLALLLIAAAIVFVACSSPSPSSSTLAADPTGVAAPGETDLPAQSQLKEGDVIQIAFPGATNLNTSVKIPFDGIVKLPFAGDFRAAGQTPQQLQDDILKTYGPQLQVKEVSITILSTSATVYVSGAVLRPGRVPLDRPLTVMEAIMECGGFDNVRARPNKVKILRMEGNRQISIPVDLKKALQGEETTPVYVKPSDVIHVPAKSINL